MTLELAYTETGEGPPLVILHGLFGSSRNWASVARRLGETHRVFAVDLRNHGASPWAETMDYGEMAEDVRAFLARHGLTGAAVSPYRGENSGPGRYVTESLTADPRVREQPGPI